MDFFDATPSKSLPSDSKKATTSKTKTDDTKQASSVSVDFFTASSGSGATVTPEKSGGFLRLPKPSKKKTPPRVREDTASAAASRTERISAVSVSTLSRPSQSSRAIPKFGQGTPVSQEKSTLSQDFFSVATNVSAASDEVTLSHPAATMPKASGFTLRLPKASKKKTPPRERERGPNQSIGFFGAARSEQASVQSSTASDVLDPDSSIQFALGPLSELEQQVPQEFHTATSTESKTEEVNKEAAQVPETTFLSAESIQPQFAAEASSELEQQVPQQEFRTATGTESKTEEVNKEATQVPETTFLSAESIQPQFAADASSELEQQVPQQEFHTATSTESKTEEVNKEAAHIPETTFLSAESIQPQFAAEASSELEQQVPQQEFHTASSTESKTEEVNKEAAQVPETTFLSAESIQPQFAAEASSELEQQVPQQEFRTATSTESKTEEVNKEAAQVPETTFLSAESIQPQFAAEASSELEQQVPQQEFRTATSTESKTQEVNKEAAHIPETTFLSAESIQPQFAAEASSELEQQVPQQEFHTARSTESKTEEVNKEAAQVSETTFLSAESMQPRFAAEASSELEQQVPQQEFRTATSTESKTEEVNKEAAQVSETTFLSAESMQPQFAAEASSELEQQLPQQEFRTATSTESKTEEVNKEATQIPETTAESIQPQFAAEALSEAEQQVPQQQEFHTATSTESKTEEANKEAAHMPATTFQSAESIQPQFAAEASSEAEQQVQQQQEFHTATSTESKTEEVNKEAAQVPEATFVSAESIPQFGSNGSPSYDIFSPSTRATRSKGLHKQRDFGAAAADQHLEVARPSSLKEEAAAKIQAQYRGRLARLRFTKVKAGLAMARLRVRVHKYHEDASATGQPDSKAGTGQTAAFLELLEPHVVGTEDSRSKAALKIQAVFRGKMARRHVAHQQGEASAIQAATRIQAMFRGRQSRKAKSKTNQPSLGIHQVGQLRIKAFKQHDAAAASPRSPMVQQEQKAFLETPAHSPRTQAEDRAAIRLQAVIRGLRVRRQIGLKKKAASKIQARFRGWQGRKLAHDLASVVNLRVRVHNFHASAAFASTAGKFPSKQIDPTFFDAKTGRVVAQLTEETAAMKIQKFYRTKTMPSDQPIAQQSLNLGTGATMQAVGSAVRRSLVAAGFAVVGEANANISQLFTRASITFDEALQAGDRAAQRASVAMGESLLQMVVDTTSPPTSPNAAGPTEDEEDSDDSDVSSEEATGPQEQKPAAKERRKLKPKQAVASFIRSMDQSCVA